MSGPLQVLVDGRTVCDDWPLDRALQYGDGLFETLTVRGQRLRFETLHRQRLAHGCRRLGIVIDEDDLWKVARSLARAHGECTLKILVSRGSSQARGYTPPQQQHPRVLHMAYPAPTAAEIPPRVRVVTLRSVLGENPALAGLKHCNRLEQVLGRMELQHTGAFEGLMGSSSGSLVSGTMSNVFVGQEGGYVTPHLDLSGVAGVMRAVVLREAAACGLAVREGRMMMSDLRACRSLFITNARMGVVEVNEIDGRELPADPALRRLADRVGALAD
ncbi:MAG TPA: aminodeoxychorismate lyase [Steroidobacteraceae bacterium]|nr:aminodeoxychorismate lyase [Steroidobacteraceae bacterium]